MHQGAGSMSRICRGVWGVGETRVEVLALIRGAIELHMEVLEENGEEVPAP